MPQLDKYIFFNQIIYLTFFFTLIYMYIRGTVVPKISTLLKYRKKRVTLFQTQLEGYVKVLNFSKSFFDKKGKTYLSFVLEQVNAINSFYQKKSSEQILNLYNKLFANIKNSSKIINSITKNRIELKRLNNFVK